MPGLCWLLWWLPRPRDVLEGGGGGRGVWLGPPSSQGPPMVPAEGRSKFSTLKSSWHRRCRSKILVVNLKHWKGRRGGGGGSRGEVPPRPPVYGRSNTSLPLPLHTHPGGGGLICVNKTECGHGNDPLVAILGLSRFRFGVGVDPTTTHPTRHWTTPCPKGRTSLKDTHRFFFLFVKDCTSPALPARGHPLAVTGPILSLVPARLRH